MHLDVWFPRRPGAGVVPVPRREPRYVFHDVAAGRYWGRYDGARGEIVYNATSG